jgi:hypothetical protein
MFERMSADGISRRDFTLQSAMAVLAGVTITVGGCGSKSPASPTSAVTDVNGVISANHGHKATIQAAQITAGNALSLDIRGEATHPHTVALTQGQLQTLKNRQPVTTESTNDNGHTHTVTFAFS